MMEALVSIDGRMTLPAEMREKLGVKNGGKIFFIEKDHTVVVMSPTRAALEKVGKAFEGEAERLGLKTEEDVVALVKEVRREMWEERNAGNN